MDAKTKSKNSFNKQAADYDTNGCGRYLQECYSCVLKAVSGIKFNRVLDLGCRTAAGFDIVSWKLITANAYLSISRSSQRS